MSDGGSEFLPMTQAKVFAENKRRGQLVRGVWKDLRIIEEIHIYYLRMENPAIILKTRPLLSTTCARVAAQISTVYHFS